MNNAMEFTCPKGQQLYCPTSTEILGAHRGLKGTGLGSQSHIKFPTASEHDAAGSSDRLHAARNKLHLKRLRNAAWNDSFLFANTDFQSAIESPTDKKLKVFLNADHFF